MSEFDKNIIVSIAGNFEKQPLYCIKNRRGEYTFLSAEFYEVVGKWLNLKGEMDFLGKTAKDVWGEKIGLEEEAKDKTAWTIGETIELEARVNEKQILWFTSTYRAVVNNQLSIIITPHKLPFMESIKYVNEEAKTLITKQGEVITMNEIAYLSSYLESETVRHAAVDSGVSQSGLEKSMLRLSRKLGYQDTKTFKRALFASAVTPVFKTLTKL